MADGVAENRLSSRRITAAMDFHPSDSSSVIAEYTSSLWTMMWNRPVAISAAADILSGKLDLLGDASAGILDLTPYRQEQYTSRLKSVADIATLRARGPLPQWLIPPKQRNSDVQATFSAMMEHRYERFRGGEEYVIGADAPSPVRTARFPHQGRSIDSLYAEAVIPFGKSFDNTPQCQLTLAGRVDWYRAKTAIPRIEEGSGEDVPPTRSSFVSPNPSIALGYHVLPSLSLRASFDKAFRPPSGDEVSPAITRVFPTAALSDPRRGDEPVGAVPVTAGGNASAEPERSRSFSVGLVADPPWWPGLQLSVDRVEIWKWRSIVSPADLLFSDFARFEELYPDRVKRNDPVVDDAFSAGTIMSIDATSLNVAEEHLVAWDTVVRYEGPQTRFGRFRFSVLGTHQPKFERRTSPESELENDAGVTASSPLKFNGVATVAVANGDWTWRWRTRYADSYRVSRSPAVITNQGARTVSGQTYHDASVAYRFRSQVFRPTSFDVQLTIQNVLGAVPPFDAGDPSAGYASRLGDPRGTAYAVSVSARL
jgi:outer membrane receptor protein involved in Fe transport